MRIIDIPQDIEVKLRARGGEEVKQFLTFKEWLQDMLDANPYFGKGMKQVRQGVVLAGLIAQSNGTLKLENAEYDLVKQSIEGAQTSALVARQVIAFYEAVENAQEVKT